MFYGALTEYLDAEQRADVDAILRGEEPPSEVRARAENQSALIALAMQGDVY